MWLTLSFSLSLSPFFNKNTWQLNKYVRLRYTKKKINLKFLQNRAIIVFTNAIVSSQFTQVIFTQFYRNEITPLPRNSRDDFYLNNRIMQCFSFFLCAYKNNTKVKVMYSNDARFLLFLFFFLSFNIVKENSETEITFARGLW